MINELKAMLVKLEELEKITNHAEADYEAEPENAEYEATFDRAYKNEFAAYMECVKMIQQISGGKIDFQTAKKIISTERVNLFQILDKFTLNSICERCTKLGKTCNGTTCKTWTGCAMREVA